ncbi:MAG: IS1 family transposase, partial [Magnetococcales bacterium]|nr:IS1 family transposase [Magnetococcales bacterium]
ATLRRLTDRLSRWNVVTYYTDHWEAYSLELPKDIPLIQSKAETVAVERNNGRQRHWFARFRRRTIVVSKSLEMVDLTVALFVRFHVNGDVGDVLSFIS